MERQGQFRICRTCLKTVSKREKMLPVLKISNMLMSYTSVTITENDGLPSSVCGSCRKRANQAYEFKLLCEQSDKKLRSEFSTLTKANSVPVKQDVDDDSIKLENESHSETFLLPGSSVNVLAENAGDSIIKFLENNLDVEQCAVKSDHEVCYDIQITNQSNEENDELQDHNLEEKQNLLINNLQANKSKQLQCRFCDMTFMHQTRLLKHEVKHENGIKCYICGKDYSTFKQLTSHISIHNRKGAHLCQTCGKQFTMPENLVRHQRIHSGIRPYKCKNCSKSFTQSNELKSHMITHSSEKTHLCNVCGNKYARQMSLQVHMRRLHSDSSTKRPYPCDICGRAFKDKRDLSQHTSIHKGERKHVCKVCSKAFNRSSNLKVHERIHSGHRPFVCHICQRAFIQKHVLNTHLRTHPNM